MKTKHSEEGFRGFIFGLIALMSLPTLIPFGGVVIFSILIFGPLAVLYGTIARRKKDNLGILGQIWGGLAMCIGFLMILSLIE
jgi:hypothetical protein